MEIFKTEELETRELKREEIIGLVIDNYNACSGNIKMKWHDAKRPEDLTIYFLDTNDIVMQELIIDKIYYKNYIRPTLKIATENKEFAK